MSKVTQQHEGPMPREIQVGDDVSLRILQPKDARRIFEVLQTDPDIQQYYVTWTAGAKSQQEIAGRIQAFNASRSLRYGIFAEGTLVGYIGTWQATGRKHEAEYDIGYFCDPSYRGQGIVPRATEALMTAARERLDAQAFVLFIADRNQPSQAVAAKLGFQRTDETALDEILGIEERRWEKVVSDE